ncbi:hypothetical protein Moror_10686 [Moniliophthora roreri MCA 2997]|uniref:MYND-type domain-containing protein n=1 Tax=Moniliophthora roreri (strain MCA 2997) TaxID=1381753 RepID=V2XGP4_MONRO|nr:hypothetical protein Moror_10686 [Moniliophthora roreri MCA 2997]
MEFAKALHQFSEKTSHHRETFLSLAHQHHSSCSKAIAALRRLDEPPAPDVINSSPNSGVLQIALEAMSVLGDSTQSKIQLHHSQAILLIKKNWGRCIGPWVKFFIENVALAEEGSGIGIELTDKVMFTLPLLILYPTTCGEQKDAEGGELMHIAPYILPLCTRVWLKVMYLTHWSWPKWCAILDGVLCAPKHSSAIFRVIEEAGAGKNVVHFGVRYLNYVAKDIRDVVEFELSAFRHMIILCTICFCAGAPFNVSFLQNGGASVTVRALRALCSPRKVLRNVAYGSSDFKMLIFFTACTARFLDVLLSGISGIPDALDAGLLSIMLRTEPFHRFEFNHGPPLTSFNPDYTVWSSFTSLLKHISLFLVYPPVLRRVVKFASSGLTLGSYTVAELRASWEQCKRKASQLKVTHDALKHAGMLCCFPECPHRLNPCAKSVNTRYRRCSTCLHVMYCSRSCAKQNWAMEHKNYCKVMGSLLIANRYNRGPTQADQLFFKELVQVVPEAHALEIINKMASFVPPAYEKDPNIVGMKRVNDRGVLVIDFSDREKQDAENFSIRPFNQVSNDIRRLWEKNSALFIDYARGLADGKMLVVAYFPSPVLGSEKIWSLWDSIDVPRKVSAKETNLNR